MKRGFISIVIAFVLVSTQVLWAGPVNLAKTSPLPSGGAAEGRVPTVAEIRGLGFTGTLAPMLGELIEAVDDDSETRIAEARGTITTVLERFCESTTIRIVPEWETLEVNTDGLIQIVLVARRNGDTKRVLFLSSGEVKEPPTGVETFGHEEARSYINEVMRDPRTRVEEISRDESILVDFLAYIDDLKERGGIEVDVLNRMGFSNIGEYRDWLGQVAREVEHNRVRLYTVEAPSYVPDVSSPAIVIKYINGKLRFISAYIDNDKVYTAKGFLTRRSSNEVFATWLHELSHYFGATEDQAIARERFIIGLEGEVSRVWSEAKQDVRTYWAQLTDEVEKTYYVRSSPFLQQVVPTAVYERYVREGLPLANIYRRTLVDEDRLGYLYAANRPDEVRKIAAVAAEIREKQRRTGKPIRAVVVLGIGEQSLGNRSVLQALGVVHEIQFLYPDNIGNPLVWLSQLEEAGIKGDEVLLYISSKGGKTDEVMSNMQIFWEWQIRSIARERLMDESIGEELIRKIRGLNNITASVVSQIQDLTEQEREILNATFGLMVVNTTLAESSALYKFAVNNVVPVAGQERLTQILKNIVGRFTVLSESSWFTTAMAGYDIVAVQEAIQPAVEVFKSENPEENPALRAAVYSYLAAESGKRPILAVVTNDEELQRRYGVQLKPVLEWTRQLVMESLGREGRGPYLHFVSSQEELDRLAQGEDNIVYLGLNMGEGKVTLPKNRPGFSVNIKQPNIEGLAQLYLFLEEFTVRYGTLLGVNPFVQPWVDEFKSILKEKAKSPEERERIRREMEEARTKPEFRLNDSNVVSSVSEAQVGAVDRLLDTAYPEAGRPLENGQLETAAREGAKLMYLAGLHGKRANPVFIYSNNPEVHKLGEYIKRLGQERFAKYGGLLWDYLIGTTDQHSSAQWLGAGTDIAYTTFIHFVSDTEGVEQPRLTQNGLVQPYLNDLTPKEISTFYLEAVRAAFTGEGRLNATVRVPVENEEALGQIKDLFARMDEIYSRMLQQEPTVPSSGERRREGEGKGAGEGRTPEALVTEVAVSPLQSPTLSSLVQENEHTVVDVEKSEVRAGTYLDEVPVAVIGANGVVQALSQVGARQKSIFNPRPGEGTIRAKIAEGWGRFLVRLDKLKALVNILMNKKGSFLQRLNPAEPRKDKKVGIYAFRFEATIAELEKGQLPQELIVKKANIMIAKVIEQIKESDPDAQFVVFSSQYTQPQMSAVLQHIECGGVFDLIVHGGLGSVRERVRTWEGRLVVASTERIEGVRSLVVPNPSEGFIPFPELVAVMQELAYADSGPLDEGLINQLVRSYEVWLRLSEIDPADIETEAERFRKSLESSQDLVVHLFIPPTPKPGSVIDLLNQEYKTEEGNSTFA